METLAPIEVVDLEISATCNLRCRFCVEAFDRTGRRGRTMRLDEWRAVSEANLRPPYNIVFSGFCEPLLHPQIEAFVAYEKNRGNRVNIGTNGLLLDAPVRARLLELGVDRFSVSLQSLNAESSEPGCAGAADTDRPVSRHPRPESGLRRAAAQS